jgi:hypothetical protein
MTTLEPRLQLITVGELRRGENAPHSNDPKLLGIIDSCKQKALCGNPCARDEDPACILGLIDNKVVGRMDMFPSEMLINGDKHRLLFGSHLFVDEPARPTGIGLAILLRFQSLNHTVAVCGVSQMIKPIYEKLGWVNFAMSRMVLIRRSQAFVQTVVKHRHVAAIAGFPIDLILRTQRLLLRFGYIKRQWIVRREDPRELGLIDHHITNRVNSVRIARPASWYNWLLTNTFSAELSRDAGFYSVRGTDNVIVGTFTIKSRRYSRITQRNLENLFLGSLQDWTIYAPTKIGVLELYTLAVQELSRKGVDAIEICEPNSAVASLLKRNGFFPMGELNFLYKARRESPVLEKRFADISQWDIRPIDGDNFFT